MSDKNGNIRQCCQICRWKSRDANKPNAHYMPCTMWRHALQALRKTDERFENKKKRTSHNELDWLGKAC